jgi:hypothetical protein
VLFGLVSHTVSDAALAASAASVLREWQTATGKPPSKHEFAAVVAACEDRAKSSDHNSPIEGCLADYGLRRVR